MLTSYRAQVSDILKAKNLSFEQVLVKIMALFEAKVI